MGTVARRKKIAFSQSLSHAVSHSLIHWLLPSFMYSLISGNYNSFIQKHWFIQSVTRSSIHSFIHSFIPSFTQSLICTLTRPFIRSFMWVMHSFIHTFIHSVIHLPAHRLTHSLIHPFNQSLVRSIINVVHLCISNRSVIQSFNQRIQRLSSIGPWCPIVTVETAVTARLGTTGMCLHILYTIVYIVCLCTHVYKHIHNT